METLVHRLRQTGLPSTHNGFVDWGKVRDERREAADRIELLENLLCDLWESVYEDGAPEETLRRVAETVQPILHERCRDLLGKLP